LSHSAFAPPNQRKHVQINRGAAEKSSTIDFSAKVGLERLFAAVDQKQHRRPHGHLRW
jgi:hypothetical protein